MKKFFDPENNLWSWIGRIPDMILLSLLWLVLSIPIVTLVPASIALYDAVARNVRPDEKGAYRRFFRTFRKELGRGILMGLLWIVIAAVLYVGYSILSQQAQAGDAWAAYALVYQILSLLPLSVFLWVIPLESRFIYGYWQLHKNAILFSVCYLPRTLLLLVFTVLGIVACCFYPLAIIVMPALLALLFSIPIEKVFKKYTPETGE